MEFSDFANKLGNASGIPDNKTADYCRTLFEKMYNVDIDDNENPVNKASDASYKAYYTGDRKIGHFCSSKKMMDQLSPQTFADYLEQTLGDPQRWLLIPDFSGICPGINVGNLPNKLADLFLQIIKDAVAYSKRRSNKKMQDVQVEKMTTVDSVLLNECNNRCALCGGSVIATKKGKVQSRYEIVQILPSGLPEYQKRKFLNAATSLGEGDEIDNLIILCRDDADDYRMDPDTETYKKLVEMKKRQQQEAKVQNELNTIALDKDIALVIKELGNLVDDPEPDQNKDEEAHNVEEKIPDNFILMKYIRSMAVTYSGFIKNQIISYQRKHLINFKLIKNEINHAYLVLESENYNQSEIFNKLTAWVMERTKSTDVTACQIVVSFFVQICEVFDVTPE